MKTNDCTTASSESLDSLGRSSASSLDSDNDAVAFKPTDEKIRMRAKIMAWRPGHLNLYTVHWLASVVASYAIPLLLFAHALLTGNFPTLLQALATPVMTVALIGISMSICLHRYFSHGAFQTSRPFQFILGIISCLGYQCGPVWWAAAHKRHHCHCDQERDPHSWVATGSFLYAWVGWTLRMDGSEAEIQEAFVPAHIRDNPELRVLDVFWYAPPFAACKLAYHTVGYHNMLHWVLMPMLLCRLVTLAFNCQFHSPLREESGKKRLHDYQTCRAMDFLEGGVGALAALVGEAHHLDHHIHPKRAKRPGVDLPYYASLMWWKPLGLVSDPHRGHA